MVEQHHTVLPDGVTASAEQGPLTRALRGEANDQSKSSFMIGRASAGMNVHASD